MTFLIVAAIIPWSNSLSTISLFTLGLLLILFYRREGIKIHYRAIFLICVLFLINVVASFFQPNMGENFLRVIGQFHLFVIPVLFFLGKPPISKQDKVKISLTYAISTLIMACTNYIWAVFVAYNQHQQFIKAISTVKYDVFSMALIHHHQLYMGMYLSFAAAILFYLFLRKPFDKKSFAYLFPFAITVVLIVVLSARMTFLTTICVIILLVFKKSFPPLLKVGSFVGILILLVLAYSFNPKLQRRINFIKDFSLEYNYHEDWAYQGLALRLMNWECSLLVARDNIFTGVGIANVQESLDVCYKEKKFDSILWFDKNLGAKFNSHNMYLQTFVASGIFGFLLFLGSILVLFIIANKGKNELLLIFLFLFCFQGLTESLLYREKGVFFFAFFCSLLMIENKNTKVILPKANQ